MVAEEECHYRDTGVVLTTQGKTKDAARQFVDSHCGVSVLIGKVLRQPVAAPHPRIKASISSAFTGTPRLISSHPVAVTMASSSIRMPML